ncbi:MAG TPA: hypothetical protein VMW52_06305, partial [Phycisphaerae bacterium]|nr:hypothetical protein [Phycisphaerae bacterium]
QVHLVGRMVGVIESEFVVQAGRRLLWLRQATHHGSWGEFLAAYFPDLPDRTARYWMAEARYYLEHGRRKTATLAVLPAGGCRFEGDEADELDADDLADPRKPAPKPRKELESDVARLHKRLAARDRREESLQREIEALEGRLERAEKARDEDETPEEWPLRRLLAKAVLTVGRVGVVYAEEATPEDLAAEIRAGAIPSLLSRLHQATERVTRQVYGAFRIAYPGKPWTGPEPADED